MSGSTFSLVELVIAALGPTTALLLYLAFRRKKRPQVSSVPSMLPPKPPEPEQTANEVKNDDELEEANAVADAAERHDVPADTVASDIAWADDVREP